MRCGKLLRATVHDSSRPVSAITPEIIPAKTLRDLLTFAFRPPAKLRPDVPLPSRKHDAP